MKRYGKTSLQRKSAAVLALGLAGAGLIGFGLQKPRDPDPAGWIRMNEPLAAVMAGSEATEGVKGSGQGSEGSAQGSGEGTKGSGQGSVGSADGSGEGSTKGSVDGGVDPASEAGGQGAGAGQTDPDGIDQALDVTASAKRDVAAASETTNGDSSQGYAVQSASGPEAPVSGAAPKTGDQGEIAGKSGSPQDGTGEGKLDLNRAGAEQLDSLPGIGPAKAKAIIEDRNQNGFFRSLEDLQRVKGIGPKTVERWKDLVVVLP